MPRRAPSFLPWHIAKQRRGWNLLPAALGTTRYWLRRPLGPFDTIAVALVIAGQSWRVELRLKLPGVQVLIVVRVLLLFVGHRPHSIETFR